MIRTIHWDDRVKIREIYGKFLPVLLEGHRVSPYDMGIDWYQNFTPIEDNAWDSIRYLGLPLYPQFPVGNYFVDFGDPVRKIAIEVDGLAWHRNIEKDRRRERAIMNLGWDVHRFPGYMTQKTREDYLDDDGYLREENRKKFLLETAEGQLILIYQSHFWEKKMYVYEISGFTK